MSDSAPDKAIQEYDAIVVGAGAAGGIVAGVLAEAGKHVLLLERGRRLGYQQVPGDHLRNHRLSIYGHNMGPELDGHPRVFVDRAGTAYKVRPHEGGYHNNAMGVGGGTLVYHGQAWRFMPQDFRMAEIYGRPEGSSLANWPIGYEDLAPWYEKVEWEIGVAGDAKAQTYHPARRGYPMPSVPANPEREILGRGAGKLGWNFAPVPLLINTVPYLNRPACIQCCMCVGFACSVDAKNGSQNTMLLRALATGRCKLVDQAFVEKITTDARGHATGVSYFTEHNGLVEHHAAQAKVVVLSAGAIESARLLLNSKSDHHPRGIGNGHDLVGRNYQGHYYPAAFGLFHEETHVSVGPGSSISTCHFNHGNAGIVGGGMLGNDNVKFPIQFIKQSLPPRAPRWGLAGKKFVREHYRHTIQVTGPVQDIPNPESRITVDSEVHDKFGIPVARLSGTTHPETVRTAEFMRYRAEDWLRASGAYEIWSYPCGLGLSGGQHQAGTCRMGKDAGTSVTDAYGRVHGQERLFVADGGLHVTNGGFNPVLTIMALAFRDADHIARNM